MYTYTGIYIEICIFMRMCMNGFMYVYEQVHTHAHVGVYIRVHTCIQVYILSYT